MKRHWLDLKLCLTLARLTFLSKDFDWAPNFLKKTLARPKVLQKILAQPKVRAGLKLDPMFAKKTLARLKKVF